MQEDLYAIDLFVVRPATLPSPQGSQVRLPGIEDLCPEPDYPCSYSQLVHPDGVDVDFFVSHFWGHPFSMTMAALTCFVDKSEVALSKDTPKDATFWICLFAVNQHRAAEEVGSSPDEGPFNAALVKSRHGCIMIVDRDIAPLERIWCLFEVHTAGKLGKRLELITEHGSLLQAHDDPTLLSTLAPIGRALESVAAIKAKASMPEDKVAISYRIANPFVRALYTESEFKQRVRMEQGWFEEFDVFVSSLLARPLFLAALQSEDGREAMQCLAQGADCSVEELAAVEGLGTCLRSSVRARFADACSLVHVMAYFGRGALLAALLARRLSATELDSRGHAPLHSAARQGHVEVAELLLKASADAASAAPGTRSTALHRAAYAGHEAMVSLLLDYRANALALDSDEWTPVSCAAVRGHKGALATLLARGGPDGSEVPVGHPLRLSALRFAQRNAQKDAEVVNVLRGGAQTQLSSQCEEGEDEEDDED